MRIVEYLEKNRRSGQGWKRDNIELVRPVVNVFLGDFKQDEIDILKTTLEQRIGVTQKVFYCQVGLEKSNSGEENGIYQFVCPNVDPVNPYDVQSWERIKSQACRGTDIGKEVRNFVNNVFNAVATVAYTSKGIIRLNYILKMDSVEVALMPAIARAFNDCFIEYFNNGVYADVYCLLDQKGYSCEEYGEERKALNYRNLTEINALTEEKLFKLTYIMSNYTSLNCLSLDCLEDQMQTIALHSIIKDGKTAGNESNAYSNESFMVETNAYAGNFCSLGKLKLEVNEEIRSRVVYKTVFEDLCKSAYNTDLVDTLITNMGIKQKDLETKMNGLVVTTGFADRMFHPMVISSNINAMEFLSAKRKDLIEDIFGRNLEFFWDLNSGSGTDRRQSLVEEIMRGINTTLAEAYKSQEYSLSEIAEAIAEAETLFMKYLREYEQSYMDAKRTFEKWKDEKSGIANIKDKAKETNVLQAVYVLARQYMERRVAIVNEENYYHICKDCLKGIKESAAYYKKQEEMMLEATDDLKDVIADMMGDQEKLVAGNMDDYYTTITKDFITKDLEYKMFKQELNQKICSRMLSADGIFKEIISFCEKHILTDERYPDNISVEMLKRLKNYDNLTSDALIYDLAFETIMNRTNYYANYIEVGQIYNAVCFLVNPENEFVQCTNRRMKELLTNQQMKIFYENHYNGMDVLFMEGCFSVESLYQYKQLYQKAWEELTQE